MTSSRPAISPFSLPLIRGLNVWIVSHTDQPVVDTAVTRLGTVKRQLRIAKDASVAGFVDTQGDQDERNCHEHPARMKAER
jgi:hypothetical protein